MTREIFTRAKERKGLSERAALWQNQNHSGGRKSQSLSNRGGGVE